MSKTIASEAMIQGSILQYLAARHIWAMRMNSGTQVMTDGEKRRAIHMHEPGTADILVLYRPISWEDEGVTPIWIEVKSAKGKQSSKQKEFQLRVEDEGHKYILARSIDDIVEVLA